MYGACKCSKLEEGSCFSRLLIDVVCTLWAFAVFGGSCCVCSGTLTFWDIVCGCTKMHNGSKAQNSFGIRFIDNIRGVNMFFDVGSSNAPKGSGL